MADFIQALDPSKLVLAGTCIAFATAPFAAPGYNLPIFLFGSLAQEASDAVQSLNTFTGILGVSMIFDIIWLARNSQNIFIRLLTILLLIMKLPTTLAFAMALRSKGNLGIRGGDLSGPTVWSMPGGFTSGGREGYQEVDEEIAAPKPMAPAARPPQPQPANVGGYQSV